VLKLMECCGSRAASVTMSLVVLCARMHAFAVAACRKQLDRTYVNIPDCHSSSYAATAV